MGSSKKQTIGYRYFMGLHFGLCHGPVDAFMEVRGGDRTAWKGSGYTVSTDEFGNEVITPSGDAVGEVTASGRIYINAPNLWGGEKKEGGIVGAADVMMGEATQAANDYLASKIGGPMPAFRGLCSLVFRGGMVGAMNPYPKPWKFQVRRILNGWQGGSAWYPEKAEVPVRAEVPGTPAVIPFEYEGGENFPTQTTVNLGRGPKTVTFEYITGEIPDKFIVEVDGVELVNTGYVGDPNYFMAAYGMTTQNALTYELGLRDLPSETVHMYDPAHDGTLDFDTNPGVMRLTFSKASATATATLKVYGPLTGTAWACRFIVHGSDASPALLGMNPAHIAYEALTNPEWGLGYPEAMLDAESFTAAADVFHAEGLGLCLQWVRQDTIEGFIQDVMNHAGAVLAQDPRTALFRILPIRGDYVVAELPEFRRGLNVVAVESFERASITETTNEVTVLYTDAATGKEGSVTIQHLANIQAQGGVASQTIRYPGAPTLGLAQRFALRDLTAKAAPLCKVRIIVDRSGYGILPGEVVRWSDSKLGIVDMPMRVLQVGYGGLTDGRITLDLAEDVFGLPAATYLGQQDSGWEEPATGALPSPDVTMLEIPYVTLVATLGAATVASLDAEAGYVGMAAASPGGGASSFALYSRVGSADYAEVDGGTWSPGGLLSEEVGPLDTELTLTSVYGYDQLTVGMLAMLGTGADAELVRVDAGNATEGTLTVGRGCADTVPRAWPLGTRLWVLTGAMAVDPTEYATGETVDGKAATDAADGPLSLDDSPGDSVTLYQRQARPYPPGNVKINGEAYPAAVADEFIVTWAHRNRVLQADQLVDTTQASVALPDNTRYGLRFLDSDDALLVEKLDIGGDTATVSLDYTGDVTMELYTIDNTAESAQRHRITFAYSGMVGNTIDADAYTPVDDAPIIDGGDLDG